MGMNSYEAGQTAYDNDATAWAAEGRPFLVNDASPLGWTPYTEAWWHSDDAIAMMVELGVEDPNLGKWEQGYMDAAAAAERIIPMIVEVAAVTYRVSYADPSAWGQDHCPCLGEQIAQAYADALLPVLQAEWPEADVEVEVTSWHVTDAIEIDLSEDGDWDYLCYDDARALVQYHAEAVYDSQDWWPDLPEHVDGCDRG